MKLHFNKEKKKVGLITGGCFKMNKVIFLRERFY